MAIDKTISTIGVDSGADNGKLPAYNSTTGVFDMVTAGVGDVTGPAGATANSIPLLDATGKILSESALSYSTNVLTSSQAGLRISTNAGTSGDIDIGITYISLRSPDSSNYFDATDTALTLRTAGITRLTASDSGIQLGTSASLDVNGNSITTTVVNGDVTISPNGTGNVLLGNFTLDADQTVGVGTDNYVLTYDNGTGLISLEASVSGATQLSELSDVNTSTATNRNVLVADGVDWESRALLEADISDLQSYVTTRTGVYRQVWIGAGAMIPRTTNGAEAATTELATNDIMYDSLNFDATTEEGAGFWINLGDQWNAGTVKLKAYWTAASGTGTVKFDFAAQSYADSDVLDQALGTEQGTTDTLLTANDMHISPATAALTVADATAGEPIYFQVTRDVATDTLGVDAQLLGVMIQYLESSTEQSAW